MDSQINKIIASLQNQPKFRIKQILHAFFDTNVKDWDDVTTLPKSIREELQKEYAWFTCEFKKIFESKKQDTFKAILKAQDGMEFESVLMENAKGQYTICVSSQVGCAMGCTFCATGMMGLKRQLSSDEIIDQYRLWNQFITEKFDGKRISNIVFMGMGEPLANYKNVKEAITVLLEYTDLGPKKIMVSTVGVLRTLDKILEDESWPGCRIAISLHSPDPVKRKEIVPSTIDGFHKKFAAWSHQYQAKYGNRNTWLTFEYTLIDGVNDSADQAHALAKYTKKTSVKKINVIPLNPVGGKSFTPTAQKRIDTFKKIVRSYDIDIVQRKTMGEDIDAACGQLLISQEK